MYGGVNSDYFAPSPSAPRPPAPPGWRPPAFARARGMPVLVSVAVSVVLGLLRLHAMASSGPSYLADRMHGLLPPAGVGESAAPLATPPVTLPMPAGTAYTFIHTQDASNVPVTWSPCRAIHYVTRPDNEPPGGAQLVREAFAELTAATGLRFVDDGRTTEPVSTSREPYQPARYGKRWAPVLVSWTGAGENADFASDVVGEAGPVAVRTPSGDTTYVSGVVMLDFAKMSTIGARGRYDVTRGVVLHELGHLVGLGHVSDPVQIMYPQADALATDYALGDRAGLALLGRGPCQPDI